MRFGCTCITEIDLQNVNLLSLLAELNSKEAAKDMIKEISQKNRYQCKGCQRRFGGERIEQHCNSCRRYQSSFFRDYQVAKT